MIDDISLKVVLYPALHKTKRYNDAIHKCSDFPIREMFKWTQSNYEIKQIRQIFTTVRERKIEG